MFHFFSQNEFTPKRFANLAAGGNGPSSQGSQPGNPEQNRTPRAGAEQQGNDALTHLTDAVRERILELKPNELLSEDEQNESPQELVTRLKDLSKVPDSKIYEWYAGKHSDILSGTAITQQMKDEIRSREIKRFKDLVGTRAAKELDVIISSSPKPEKYSDALNHLSTGIADIDIFGTKNLIEKMEQDSKKAAKEEAEKQGKSLAEQETAEQEAKIGHEAVQYVELLRKKIELEQKLAEDRPRIAEIDAEIKAHKESEANIHEKKEQYIDAKRGYILKYLKIAGYASLAGGWLGAMSGLTGIGVSALTTLTGVTDIGFLKGLGLGATWLFQTGYHAMKGIEDLTDGRVGPLSQIAIAALTLIPLDFGIKKFKVWRSKKAHEKKKESLEQQKKTRKIELNIEGTESDLAAAESGLKKYKKINSERVKLLIGQKKHYEIIQDDYIRQIDAKRKKGTSQDIADIGELQSKLETVSKTILSLESFISLFSVSEGNRAERVISLPVLNPENITSNIQAMEDKLEPQLTQNLFLLAQREQSRLVQEQSEAKNIAKRKTFKDELKAFNENTEPSKDKVREFFKKISDRQEFSTAEVTQNQNLSKDLELKSPKTARLIKILLELPRTLFRKQVADTVLNIIDMPDQEGGQTEGQAPAAPGGAPAPAGQSPSATDQAQTSDVQPAPEQNAPDANESPAPQSGDAQGNADIDQDADAAAEGIHQEPPHETQDLPTPEPQLSPEDQKSLEDLQNEKASLESAIEALTASLGDPDLSEDDKKAINEVLGIDKEALEAVKSRIQQFITPEA